MRRALALVWSTWRVVRHDPATLVFLLVLPVALTAILGSIYTSVGGGGHELGLVAEGRGPVTSLLTEALADVSGEPPTVFTDRAAAERAVRRRTIDAVVVVPATVDRPGVSDVALVELIGPPGVAAPSGLRATVEQATADVAARLLVARSVRPDDPLGAGLELASERAAAVGLDELPPHDDGLRTRNNRAFALFAALVLFTFMNVLGSSAQLRWLRDQGVLERLRATPMTEREVVGGFVLYLSSLGIAQGAIVMIMGTATLGITWDRPAVLAVVVVAIGVAAGCLGSLVATILPGYPSGATVAGLIAFVLGMVGGCLWPLAIVGRGPQIVGHITPHAWAIDALWGVVEGSGSRGVGGPLLVLTAMSAAFVAIALPLMRRMVAVPH